VVFKTGALNHSATLPSLQDQLLSSTLDRAKVNTTITRSRTTR